MAKQLKTVTVGSEVAFNKLPDATWFEVVSINGFTLEIREAGTEYATQLIDRCYVKLVK